MRTIRSRFLLVPSVVLAAPLAAATQTPQALWPRVSVSSSRLATSSGEWVQVGGEVFIGVPEASQEADLNLDGDLLDEVLHRLDLFSGSATNLGVSTRAGSGLTQGADRQPQGPAQGFLVFARPEASDRTDLNGDGDRSDVALQVVDGATGSLVSSGLALLSAQPTFWRARELVAFEVSEAAQGRTDLNGDGDALDLVLHAWRPLQGAPRSLGLALADGLIAVQDAVIVFATRESEIGDRNGDGDHSDQVLQVYDVASETATDLGLVVPRDSLVEHLAGADGWFAFPIWEFAGEGEGLDLNGDGDLQDLVLHTYDHATGAVTNLRRAVGNACAFQCTRAFQMTPSWLAFQVPEADQDGRDLDRDGDTDDLVLFLRARGSASSLNLGLAPGNFPISGGPGFVLGDQVLAYSQAESTLDLNVDGDIGDPVLQVLRPDGSVLNTGLAALDFIVSGRWVAAMVEEAAQGGTDLNRNGDALDRVLHVVDGFSGEIRNLGVVAAQADFTREALSFLVHEGLQRSDLNGDGDPGDLVLHLYDADRGQLVNLHTAGTLPSGAGRWRVFTTEESNQGLDLNGDGDLDDQVVQTARVERRP